MELDVTGDQRLGIDQAPVAIARSVAQAPRILNEGAFIDRAEQPAALQVGGHHAGDIGAQLLLVADLAEEIGDGDRQRLDEAAGNIDLELRLGRSGHQGQPDRNRCHQDHRRAQGKAAKAPDRMKFFSLHRRHDPNISLGLKVRFICFHSEYWFTGSSKGLQRRMAFTARSAALRK